MNTQQPEALRLADWLETADVTEIDKVMDKSAAELRRQHARITELEAQLAQRFDAADMATAAAQGFRDGVASAAHWTSVDERLPEKNTEVLICFAESMLASTGQYTGHAADPAGWCYPKEAYLWPGESKEMPDGGAPTVTHWMPLPPPPSSAQKDVSNGL